ncbi:MAG: GTPase Era [Actinobacteria bacterium]|nr:GTPase Era [Actinomycetota bacterium]
MTAGAAGAPQFFRSGFVAVVGRPNVGKSTLVNALVGRKVAIVSPAPQTTRNRIAGVVNLPGCQLVLIDLPGFQKPRDLMTERMQSAVNNTLREVDLVLLVLSAAEAIGAGDRFIAMQAQAVKTPVIVAFNKIDLVPKKSLLPLMQAAPSLGELAEIIPVSAARGEGLKDLLGEMAVRMPEGPEYFPPDVVTDQTEEILVGELIREQAVRLTREEVPHSLAVRVLTLKPRKNGDLIDITAEVIIERESQKGIVIGRGGKMIKEIGVRARGEIEALLGSTVFLDLRVRVMKKWRDDERALGELGL